MTVAYQDAPKAELHLHLEGSVEPATLRELDPGLTDEEIAARYRYSSFTDFIQSYGWVIGHLKRPEDYALIARRLLERLARENIVYAEITLSAAVVLYRKQDLEATWQAIREECRRAPVTSRWIFDTVRQWDPAYAGQVLDVALRHREEGVIAFGLGGDEVAGPVEPFRSAFQRAREGGLRATIHAGETAGPDSVWAALEAGAERIGHGIHSAADPRLLEHLRENRIPLEVCVSSNVATGAVRSLDEHPLRKLYDAGVPLTLGTDDPAMFHCHLAGEYELAGSRLGFTEAELAGIAANAFRFAFDPVAAASARA